jgi:hypothetical protein
MSFGKPGPAVVSLVLTALVMTPALVNAEVSGGAPEAPSDSAGTAHETPRTPWGDPDLQGVWDYRSITPLERPPEFGERQFYTDEEIAELEAEAARRMDEPPGDDAPNLVHAQYMTDPGRQIDESRRTSLIVEPADGRLPAMTDEARARQQQQREETARVQAGPPTQAWLESRSPLERCITWGLPQALLPGLYNNNILIAQSPGYVTIVHEMVHNARIIPLDDRPFGELTTWLGESRGYWEGDTLVVQTRNFNGRSTYRGAGENMTLTERYTRIGDDRIDFRMTVEDDSTWTEPWTVALFMRPTEGGMYEYACHEGNYALSNMLGIARHDWMAAQDDDAAAMDGR